jgi:N6-L-threonylcarbamoyladenine synthase
MFGGILPPIAMDFHRENIERIVQESLKEANVTVNDLDAIAVTNRPGLIMSLKVGIRYAKHLARNHQKPLIPIHHMEAHALTARLDNEIEFPFLSLLISGGHCLLAIAEDVDKWKLLGESLDDAPGEAFDKIARELKLRNLPHFESKSGGQQIEQAAAECKEVTDKYKFPLTLARSRDCQFSFAGLKNVAKRYIRAEQRDQNLYADQVLPNYPDLCANFLGKS